MLSLYSFLFLIGLAVILNRFIFTQKLQSKFFLKVKIIAVLIICVGMMITIYSSSGISRYIASKNWIEIKSEILSSEIIGEKSFYPEIIYTYQHDGKIYIDTTTLNIPGFGGKRKRYEVAREHIALYIPWDTIKILIDPNEPQNSSVTRSVKWSVFGQFSFGCFLFFIGFVLVLMKRKD